MHPYHHCQTEKVIMRNLPASTITLLFTDIEGSTRILQRIGELYREVLTEYRQLLRSVFERLVERYVNDANIRPQVLRLLL